jgi:hypothetical protein
MTSTINDAITQSIDFDCIVTVEATEADVLAAKLASTDYAQLDDGTWDAWGVTESNCDWRLHLVAG